MATAGTSAAFSTDSHLNDSIHEILTGSGGESTDETTGATSPSSQDGSAPVESFTTPAPPSPGDSGPSDPALSEPSPTAPAAGVDPSSPGPTHPETPLPTEPFRYTVTGEDREIAEFYRIPGEGVFVPEVEVPRLQQLASRAEANETALRSLHAEHTQVNDTWQRATRWQVPGPNGQPHELSGLDSYRVQRAALEGLQDAQKLYQGVLADPNKLASLLTYDPSTGTFSFDPTAKENFELRLQRAVQTGIGRAHQHLSQLSQLAQRPTGAAPDAAPTPGVSREQVAERATEILTDRLKAWQVTGLTADDVAKLAPQLPRYTRQATAEDVQADPALKLGQWVLENEFEALVRHTASLRAGGASTQQVTQAVARFNRGQQQGRAGQAPPKAPAKPPVSEAVAERRGRRGGDRTPKSNWDAILERGLNDPDVLAALNGG